MPFEVDQETVAKTTRCLHEFACLRNGAECLCKIQYHILRELYFVENSDSCRCLYCIPCASSYVCTCPTRKELYERHHV